MAWLALVVRLIQLPDSCPKTVAATCWPRAMGEVNCNNRFVQELMPLAVSRRMESELAGSVSVKLVPALAIELVTGKTFVGAAREFPSVKLPEVNWMTVAPDATALTPVTLNVVASGAPLVLTTLTMIWPLDCNRLLEA